MPISKPARIALMLALIAPAGTAHATDAAPAGAARGAFSAHFAAFEQLPPAPVPGGGAVDVSAIEHVQSDDLDGAGVPLGAGTASYYGRQFDGRRTASGERFDMDAFTAAHRTLPFGTKVRVTNPDNGRSVVVRINDRGPFHGGRMIDLSQAAAQRLGLVARGSGRVELARVD